MSARHRHHKRFTREIEGELAANAADHDAITRAIQCLARFGLTAPAPLTQALEQLAKDRAALLTIIEVLAPNEWRWRISERWRADRLAAQS